MEWITALRAAIGYIEDNLENDIDIGTVSEHVYIWCLY